MELHEREFLVSKIILGYFVLKIKKDLVLIVPPLTVKQNFLSQEAYKQAYDDALFSGVYTRKEMLEILKENGVWTKEQEDKMQENSLVLDRLKERFFDNFFLPASKDIKKEIKQLEREQLRLHETKHANDHLDCEGIASYSRWSWMIENNTFYESGEKYAFEDVDVSTVLRYYHQERIPQEKIRELARTSPWRNIWANCNQIPKDAFDRKPNELSEHQTSLLDWTRLYDNISESAEPPKEAIINDDYALDGWLIKQRNKRDNRKREKRSYEPKKPRVEPDPNEQLKVSVDFLQGLIDSFGLDGKVEGEVEDKNLVVNVKGEQTEALVGEKGIIIRSLHELTRTAVQRKTGAGTRLRLDVADYALKRKEALTIYAERLTKQILEDKQEVMLEPMNSVDRKTLHDAVAEIDGIRSYSEGREPYRSVVFAPSSNEEE